MKMRTNLIAAAHLLALLALTALLLSGCAGSGTPGPTTGVTENIVDADTHQGIGNMVVAVGGASGISTTPTGVFTVAASPGVQQVVVQESDIFVPVPGPPIFVNVISGQMTYLGNVWVIDRNSLPPGG